MCVCEHVAVCTHWVLFFSTAEKKSDVQESGVWILLLYRAPPAHTQFGDSIRKLRGHRRRSERQVLFCAGACTANTSCWTGFRNILQDQTHIHTQASKVSVVPANIRNGTNCSTSLEKHDRNDRPSEQERERNRSLRDTLSLWLYLLPRQIISPSPKLLFFEFPCALLGRRDSGVVDNTAASQLQGYQSAWVSSRFSTFLLSKVQVDIW